MKRWKRPATPESEAVEILADIRALLYILALRNTVPPPEARERFERFERERMIDE